MVKKVYALLDTNVLVSGMLYSDLPSKLVDLVFNRKLVLVTSKILIDELGDVLSRSKFTKRFRAKKTSRTKIIQRLLKAALIVEPVEIYPVVIADPDDDAVIATALATHVDCIVTGNRHLLDLGEYHRIPIYRVEQFLRLFDLRK